MYSFEEKKRKNSITANVINSFFVTNCENEGKICEEEKFFEKNFHVVRDRIDVNSFVFQPTLSR